MIDEERFVDRLRPVARQRAERQNLDVDRDAFNADALPVIDIKPISGWTALDLREVWRYRELLYFLAWRDVKVRYKQTAIGAAWAILQPLLTMAIFYVVFGRLASVSSEGVPYPLFAFAALVPWTFFATAVGHGSTSMVDNVHLVSKVYFPRVIVPMATVLASAVDFAITFAVLLGLMVFYGTTPSAALVAVPVFVLLTFMLALGISFWLSAVDVKFRDVRYAVPFLVQVWLFATPVAYSSSLIPAHWRLVYSLNPMVGIIEGFRWALLGAHIPSTGILVVSALVVVAVFVSGLLYFVRVERDFADVV